MSANTTSHLTDDAFPQNDSKPRQIIEHTIAHLGHRLPGQAPILNFVHHNTLHGYQHLPFEQALAEFGELTGIHAYLPEKRFRKLYQTEHITEADLDAALADRPELEVGALLLRVGEREVSRAELLKVSLIYPIHALSPSQLVWQIEELEATRQFQANVSESARQRLLDTANQEGVTETDVALENLWHACLEGFRLSDFTLHPEELVDMPTTLAESLLVKFRSTKETTQGDPVVHKRMQTDAQALTEQLLEDIGQGMTARGLLQAFTGQDFFDQVRPYLIRVAAAHLDEGWAAWNLPERTAGFYTAWRRFIDSDPAWNLVELPRWREALSRWSDDPMDTIITELHRLRLPESRWEGYLTRLALELPGWSGMVNWRQQNANYPANQESPTTLTDYLAIRLCLDSLWIEHLCRKIWHLEGGLPALSAYLRSHPAEALIRHTLYAGQSPEYLANRSRDLIENPIRQPKAAAWDTLADMIWTWQHSLIGADSETHTVHDSGWRLFQLAQHLGLSAGALGTLSLAERERLLAVLDEMPSTLRGAVWQCAYEHHYRNTLINALANNHGRGDWAKREQRPQAQVVFCIDDREEGIRRHLEELNPHIETLAAAGFFGVVMNWLGLDDQKVTPLCPVVATPAHEVREVARTGTEVCHELHNQRRDFRARLHTRYHELRRNLLSSYPLIDLLSPLALLTLLGKIFTPTLQAKVAEKANVALVPDVLTLVKVTAKEDGSPATPEQPRLGFTDAEQAERVAALLRNIGLTDQFAPLVVLMGHGSISQNNPHLAAYDCGACSGRHGGPNARAFAAMANRPEVRTLLKERGIDIPADSWFIGAEHNTCDEQILYYDLSDVPLPLESALSKFQRELNQARMLSAHERCRRFASAPRNPSPHQALRHVVGRSHDFSQARPELGHATNAAALVGRRSMSHGLFLDRRAFLVSYDPTQDPSGTVLEGVLLAVGPVGAGINLEYYFSTVNNERLGCGTKTPHNVTGLFAVMEGASSDLRTGLPRQMVEIHEPLRLQVVVEASIEVLTAIYQRQPPLQELIGGGWIHVISKDPSSGEFAIFDPKRGFVPWAGSVQALPIRDRSGDWYRGHTKPLPPALIGATTPHYKEERSHA